MQRVLSGLVVTVLGGAVAACGSGGGTAAATGSPAATATASASMAGRVIRTQLGQGTMTDPLHITVAPPSQLTVQTVTIEPGGMAPWHTHPGFETPWSPPAGSP